jgi:hypothetical protein
MRIILRVRWGDGEIGRRGDRDRLAEAFGSLHHPITPSPHDTDGTDRRN